MSLPLSAWDAEEDFQSFHDAEAVAKHWFLIAFLAIPVLQKLGRVVDPADIRELADYLWVHEDFMTKHIHRVPKNENEIVAEHAARYAIEFGEPSDTWLLDCVRHPGVRPRTLWALIDQRFRKNRREPATDGQHDAMITGILDIASERFGDGGEYGIDELEFWGRIWLLLGAIDEAEQTAAAMMAVSVREHGRSEKLMVLKLLAFVVSKRPVTPQIEHYVRRLYQELWPGSYTPEEEREGRSQIDEQLG